MKLFTFRDIVIIYFKSIGYLTTGTSDEVSAAGGAAVLDMTAALSWVNRNIAAFGGDPKRLTLLGHGAGAALVNVILMLPSSKGK